MRAKRLTYSHVCTPTLEAIDLKELSDHEVLVKTVFSGISRGTERLVYRGKVPASEWSRMRCPHQSGEFSFPITYGYASVGIVTSIGAKVSKTKIGDRVFVLHPHQDHFIVEDTWVHVLPNDLPNQEVAVLLANMETALNANWDAEIETKNSVAIIGGGVLGVLTAFICKQLSDTIPLLIDINPKRAELAKKFGLEFKLVRDLTEINFGQFECVFNTSASGKGLQLAINLADFEGKIIEMSWYGENNVSINLGGAFHSNRLSLISSQVGHVSPHKRKSHSHSDRLAVAMTFLKDPVLKELLFPIVPFEELPTKLDEVLISEETLYPLVTHI